MVASERLEAAGILCRAPGKARGALLGGIRHLLRIRPSSRSSEVARQDFDVLLGPQEQPGRRVETGPRSVRPPKYVPQCRLAQAERAAHVDRRDRLHRDVFVTSRRSHVDRIRAYPAVRYSARPFFLSSARRLDSRTIMVPDPSSFRFRSLHHPAVQSWSVVRRTSYLSVASLR